MLSDLVSGELRLAGDLGDELGIVMASRVLGVQPRLIGEQHQQPRLEHDRHLRRQEVVVAEGDLVGCRGVVLVHDRDHAPVEQPAQRLAGVQVLGPELEIGCGQQDLRRVHVAPRQALLVGPEETSLTDRRGGLELIDRRGPRRQLHHPHPAGDRARGDHHDVLAAGVQLGDLRADAVEHVAAQRTVFTGDDRRAEFGDHGHGAIIPGPARTRDRRRPPRRRTRSRLAAGQRSRRSRAASSPDSRAPRGSRGHVGRSAARCRGR